MVLEGSDGYATAAAQHAPGLLQVDVALMGALQADDEAAPDDGALVVGFGVAHARALTILERLSVTDLRRLVVRWDTEQQRLAFRAMELSKARIALTDVIEGVAASA